MPLNGPLCHFQICGHCRFARPNAGPVLAGIVCHIHQNGLANGRTNNAAFNNRCDVI